MRAFVVLAACACALAQETTTDTTTTTTTKAKYDDATANKALSTLATSACATTFAFDITFTVGDAGDARCAACAAYLAGTDNSAFDANCLASAVASVTLKKRVGTIAFGGDKDCAPGEGASRLAVGSAKSDLAQVQVGRFRSIAAYVAGSCSNGTAAHDPAVDEPIVISATGAAASTCDQSAKRVTVNLPSYSGSFCGMVGLDGATSMHSYDHGLTIGVVVGLSLAALLAVGIIYRKDIFGECGSRSTLEEAAI